MRSIRIASIAVTCSVLASAAHAACPVELATYRDRDDRASIEFRPTGEGAVVTNTFRLLMGSDVVFDGIVMWTDGAPRSFGQVGYQCPDGDVTGAEIDACAVWEGVVYALDEQGAVALMPAEGSPAPARLLLANLGYQMHWSKAWQKTGLTDVPWDEFRLSGCQE